MQFRVDSAQLSGIVRMPDSKVQYCPPVGWKSIDDEIFHERIQSGLTGQFESIVQAWKDSSSTAFLIVSEFAGIRSRMPQPESLTQQGEDLWQDVRKGHFEHQGLSFTQYLLQNSQWVSFRLFVGPSRPVVRFDYFVSRRIYPDEIRKIESSIGSIRHL